MFDRAEIVVRGGSGGTGAVGFRREKYVPFGGPDGGDGGDGGNVVAVADSGVTDLREIISGRVYEAENGGNGRGKKQHGSNGKDRVLMVPIGTIVLGRVDTGTGPVIADLSEPGQRAIIAAGGKGGLGNVHFASSTRQAPQIAQRGAAGEEAGLVLELRLIADAGIIGYPNVGKSSLLAAASAAHPRVADYPFTTLEPVLGVVDVDGENFVLAEVPGLVSGAHLGRGLGLDFLRHAMRTRVLVHLVDGSSPSPVDDMIQVNNELNLFDSTLARKPQLVVVNKIDLPEVRGRTEELRTTFASAGVKAHFVSASTGEGVSGLMRELWKVLQEVQPVPSLQSEAVAKVFRPLPRTGRVSVRKENGIFVLVAPDLERITSSPIGDGTPVLSFLREQCARPAVVGALKKAGIRPGDKVRCGRLEWEWH